MEMAEVSVKIINVYNLDTTIEDMRDRTEVLHKPTVETSANPCLPVTLLKDTGRNILVIGGRGF